MSTKGVSSTESTPKTKVGLSSETTELMENNENRDGDTDTETKAGQSNSITNSDGSTQEDKSNSFVNIDGNTYTEANEGQSYFIDSQTRRLTDLQKKLSKRFLSWVTKTFPIRAEEWCLTCRWDWVKLYWAWNAYGCCLGLKK